MPRQRSSARAPEVEVEIEALKNLPKPILDKLRALIRRVRRIQMIRGGFATLAAGALAIIASMVIGATFTILSTGVHATLTALGVAAVLATAYRTLYIPLHKKLSIPHIARVIETRHPNLQERLSTAIGLLGTSDPEAIRGSEQLLAQVVKAAICDAKVMKPKREFTTRSARRYIITTATAAAIVLLAILIFPAQSGRLLTRAIAPFSKVGNAYADRLQVEPGNIRVPAGDPVTIRVTIRQSGAERAEIRRTNAGGGNRESIETMTLIRRDQQAGTSEFAITFPAVTEKFRYRVRSGRAVSASYAVNPAKRPEITRLEVVYDFPAYTRLAPVTVLELDQEIAALTGTKIQVRAHFDRPLDSAVFKIDGNPLPATKDSSGDPNNPSATWNFDMAAGTEGFWKLALTDPEAVPNIPVEHPIRAFSDRAPTVQLLTSQAEFRVRPDQRLTLHYEASDDFGIATAALHVSTDKRVIRQNLPALTAPETYAGLAILDVSQIPLTESKTFQVFLQVEDTRPQAQDAKTGPLTITVDAAADSLAEQFVDEQRASMHDSLVAAIEKLQAARVIATTVPRELLKPEIIPLETLLHLGKVQALTGEAESLVRATAAAAAAPASLFKALSPALLATADDHLVPARQSAEEIPLTDEKITRVHRANKVVRQLDEGIADLNVAIRELKQQTAHARLLAKMSELGEKQRRLGEALAAASDPSLQGKLREQQAALAEAMNELVKDSEKSVADQLQDARHDASELAERAQQLAGRQTQLAQLFDQAEDPGLREETSDALIRQLETEQREIGNQAIAIRNLAKLDAPDPTLLSGLDISKTQADGAADALTENKPSAAAADAASNTRSLRQLEQSVDHPKIRDELGQLAQRQDGVARQIDAIARQRLDEALASMQDMVAEQAADLAQEADDFRQQAESLADPTALQQVQQASNQANQAAQSAKQASSQLGGETSTGAFDFAKAPGSLPAQQNRSPNAPPAPTQAGVQDPQLGDQLPDMSSLEGTSDNPFSVGKAAIETPPPALEDGSMDIAGGRLPPGSLPQAPSQDPPASKQAGASGQNSVASAARQPAMQAQHGLASAASSLSNAASSLGQQANSPGAQQHQQINQQMLEAAQQAAQLAIEQNPEVAAKIAQSIARKLTQPRPQQPVPTPSVKDWQSLRGKVKSGLAATAKSTTPDEYRELVKSYFKEIARRSNEPPITTP